MKAYLPFGYNSPSQGEDTDISVLLSLPDNSSSTRILLSIYASPALKCSVYMACEMLPY